MKPQKKIFVLAIIITLLALTLILSACSTQKMCFEEECFNIEIVSTNEDRMRGLMFREHLPENQGMLFVFEEPRIYSFWMKNTLIPLDMIWLNEELEVVQIISAYPCGNIKEDDPCPSYNPGVEALYVLEINMNMAQQKNIIIGSQAKIK